VGKSHHLNLTILVKMILGDERTGEIVVEILVTPPPDDSENSQVSVSILLLFVRSENLLLFSSIL